MSTTGPAPPGKYEALGSYWLRTQLFAVSYAPVLAIFAFKSESQVARLAYAVTTAILLVDGCRLTYGQRNKTSRKVCLRHVIDKGGEVSGYLASYLLPFLTGPPGDWWDAGAYLTYFTVAWIVFINSDLLLINPTLYMLGWKVVRGQRKSGPVVLVLVRRIPNPGQEFVAATLGSALVQTERMQD